MNVWILNHYAGTPAEQATRAYDLATGLVGRGHRVTVIASSFSHYRFAETRLEPGQSWKVEDHDGVRFIWLRTMPYRRSDWRRAVNMASYAVRALARGVRLSDRPDVVVGTCVHPLAPLAAYLLARRWRSRFVYEVTDLWPQTPIEMGVLRERGLLARALRGLERFLFQRAARIVSVLPHIDDYLTSRGIDPGKMVWIPNGVNLAHYEALAPYRGPTDTRFTVMYVGGHARYHGLDVILEAAALLERARDHAVRFVFVGDGPEKARLVARAQELRLGNVEFRGLVPKRQVPVVMQDADAFVLKFRDLPLLRFGASPIKLFDYLAAGRPVIYACNSRNNAVEEAMAGLTVPSEDAAGLADAVRRLQAMSVEERMAMGANGREYVKRHHDTRLLAERLERALAEAVSP